MKVAGHRSGVTIPQEQPYRFRNPTTMSQENDRSNQKPAADPRHLTPTQIGGGIGAAAAVLAYFVIRDAASRPPGQGDGSPNFLLAGLLGGVGGVLGVCIGALIGKFRSTSPSKAPAHVADGVRPSVLGRVFAVASLVCVPVLGFGLLFGITGLILNRRSRGWPWVLSLVGSILSAIVTVVVIIVIANVKR
jgi:hypothetical protein